MSDSKTDIAPPARQDELLDDEGYPTEAALARIRVWPVSDFRGLLAFVHGLWWATEWGWTEREEEGRPLYSISTGGWSGNEDLIEALQDNRMFWMLCWRLARRGGHYEFSPMFTEDAPKGAK